MKIRAVVLEFFVSRHTDRRGGGLYFIICIDIYNVPFKVIPLRYNTLVPAVFPTLEALLGIVLIIYLFINIYIVPFKVIPLRYNTLVSALFPILEAHLISTFWYSLEYLFIHQYLYCPLQSDPPQI